MDSVLHLGYSVIAFAIVSVIAVITLYYIMPETKDLSVEEITSMFRETNLFDLRNYNIKTPKNNEEIHDVSGEK